MKKDSQLYNIALSIDDKIGEAFRALFDELRILLFTGLVCRNDLKAAEGKFIPYIIDNMLTRLEKHYGGKIELLWKFDPYNHKITNRKYIFFEKDGKRQIYG